MKVLVTGAAGFIGSHTAERLLRGGHDVIVVDEVNDAYDVRQKHQNLHILERTAAECGRYLVLYKADCADVAAMRAIFEREGPIHRVCHLAARAGVRPSIQDPHVYIHSNINATVSILDLARQFGCELVVYASSSSVYGGNTKVPFSEFDPTELPVSPYAATKKACELMAATYNSLYGIPVTGLRFFTVYGPRGRPDMFPFIAVDKLFRGDQISQFGDGTSSRDYTYIDDIVSGILASLLPPTPSGARVYNLGNSTTVTLTEFIRTVETAVGKPAHIKYLPDQPGDVKLTYADLTLSKAELGYAPQTCVEDGIRELVKWYVGRNADESVHVRMLDAVTGKEVETRVAFFDVEEDETEGVGSSSSATDYEDESASVGMSEESFGTMGGSEEEHIARVTSESTLYEMDGVGMVYSGIVAEKQSVGSEGALLSVEVADVSDR
ncbi:hypothetical protein BJ742DRAFT_844566 [Cladochytrium replicatum]|nr:hypothetical protein BJ742DRAFT_844566 [Cladochytrium replicatum]